MAILAGIPSGWCGCSSPARPTGKARLTPELRSRDPDNRLLARGPRFRLSAEMIRDQALAASGLLVERLGGPSVKPYQPDGLWRELADTDYVRDRGEALYRRGLYTFWKRTVAPPAAVTFDAAGRETCSVRESRTNTPLQALVLLSTTSPMSRRRGCWRHGCCARRPRRTTASRWRSGWCWGGSPTPAERAVLRAGLERHRRHYATDRAAAVKLLAAGDAPLPPNVDPAELAAYTAVAAVILNTDEAVTRE
ncbi:MAG: DUF1553 domain-containing protein [Gemmataceae bacterium]